MLSIDVVCQFVDIFDPEEAFENVYMGMLAERVGVSPRRYRGFRTNGNGHCSQNFELIVIHEASSDL